MKEERRQFDKEFKIMTVELCLSGKSTTEVAEELALRPGLVSRWKREYQQKKEDSFSGQGKQALSPEQAEIARLKRQRASSPRAMANLPIYERASTYVCH